jgi:AcrR family transcriptional regulator
MGRTTTRPTSERILAAATDLFSGSAYSAVSVDDIARQAGLTKMTVYQHFKSKEQLFLECLETRLCRREALLDAFFANLAPQEDVLLALFDWLEDWTKPGSFRGCAFVKAVNELSNLIPQVREVAFEAKQRMKQRIIQLVKISGRPQPALLGEQIALLVEGAQSLALIEASTRPVKVARQLVKKLLLSKSGNS